MSGTGHEVRRPPAGVVASTASSAHARYASICDLSSRASSVVSVGYAGRVAPEANLDLSHQPVLDALHSVHAVIISLHLWESCAARAVEALAAE